MVISCPSNIYLFNIYLGQIVKKILLFFQASQWQVHMYLGNFS